MCLFFYLLLALLLFRFVCFVFLLFFLVSVFLKIDIGKIYCISFLVNTVNL